MCLGDLPKGAGLVTGFTVIARLIEPGFPHEHQYMCSHRDSNETYPSLYISTMELLGFIAGQP